MNRRDLLLLIGGAATAWPLAARAQQSATPVIGFLNSAQRDGYAPFAAAFRQGLKEAGYVEGQNVLIEYRWAEGQYDRLPALAAELVRRPVDVIAAGGVPAALAAKAATSTIPIVFTSGGDPIELGLVSSLGRPGGNITGVSELSVALGTKRLELLLELVPTAAVIAFLVHQGNRRADLEAIELQAAARRAGRQIVVVNAQSERDLGTAFATLVREGAAAVLVPGDPLLISQREQLVKLAARHGVPAMYEWRDYTAAGGLMSYGASLGEMYHLAGAYAGRILKGAKPGDLPVLQPTTFPLVIHLKAAKALGLTVPSSLLIRADEVIE